MYNVYSSYNPLDSEKMCGVSRLRHARAPRKAYRNPSEPVQRRISAPSSTVRHNGTATSTHSLVTTIGVVNVYCPVELDVALGANALCMVQITKVFRHSYFLKVGEVIVDT